MFLVKLIDGRTLRLSLDELDRFLEQHGSQIEVQKGAWRPRRNSDSLSR